MAYSKLYMLTQDSPPGYQYFNQWADNQADLRELQLAEHGDQEYVAASQVPSGSMFDYHQLGRHDLEEIPRTVGSATLKLGGGYSIQVSYDWVGPALPLIWRFDVGVYQLVVLGLTTWWAKVSQRGSSTITYLEPQVRPFYASAANGNNAGLRIYLHKLDAGDFIPADNSFSIALYGEAP